MLVLSRKIGEKIMIGDGIVVVVKRILGQRVTFGIEAPENVRIVRAELPRFDEDPAHDLPNGKQTANGKQAANGKRVANGKRIANGKHFPNGNRLTNGNHVPSVLFPAQPR
jgi:carbon storage regulator